MWIHALAHVITITLQFFFSSPLLVMLSETVYLFPHLFLVTRQHRKVCKCLCVCVFEKKKKYSWTCLSTKKTFFSIWKCRKQCSSLYFSFYWYMCAIQPQPSSFSLSWEKHFFFFKNAIFFPPATIVSCKCFLKCYVLLLQYFSLLYFFVYGRI